eukprot:1153081-Pelagomonas_calceolata.AAC.6
MSPDPTSKLAELRGPQRLLAWQTKENTSPVSWHTLLNFQLLAPEGIGHTQLFHPSNYIHGYRDTTSCAGSKEFRHLFSGLDYKTHLTPTIHASLLFTLPPAAIGTVPINTCVIQLERMRVADVFKIRTSSMKNTVINAYHASHFFNTYLHWTHHEQSTSCNGLQPFPLHLTMLGQA